MSIPSPKKRFEPKLIGDYKFDEVASALQKMIRRGEEYEACFWGYVLHQSGYGLYLWRRLTIISSEDVGNGEPLACIVTSSLRSNWELMHKKDKKPTKGKFLFISQAILFLCRSQKTREADHLTNLINDEWKLGKRLEMPELALDIHTQEGKVKYLKSGNYTSSEVMRIWFTQWSKITNESKINDPWKEKLMKLRGC